ncbi:MAG: sigma-70 family RNA polymerase sigma factor [Verrucomicrobiales bacterium]|nr:sigma-70 family RNA polymerase sigma factor [Verrucomicrobiales bacterium]
MGEPDSKHDPQHDHAHAFATTHWSVVVAAGDSTRGEGKLALEQLCRAYWYPLFVFVQRKGIPSEEAKDLTQAFFEDFLERNQILRADRDRGRFRSFLVRSMENFLHNEWRYRSAAKRGGGRTFVSFDAVRTDTASASEPVATGTPEAAYARQWALTVLEQVQKALEREWVAAGRSDLFRELLAHLWSDLSVVPYAELSARFDLTPVNLRVTFHRFRQRYRELLRSAIAATVDGPGEVDDELRFLMRAVGR